MAVYGLVINREDDRIFRTREIVYNDIDIDLIYVRYDFEKYSEKILEYIKKVIEKYNNILHIVFVYSIEDLEHIINSGIKLALYYVIDDGNVGVINEVIDKVDYILIKNNLSLIENLKLIQNFKQSVKDKILICGFNPCISAIIFRKLSSKYNCGITIGNRIEAECGSVRYVGIDSVNFIEKSFKVAKNTTSNKNRSSVLEFEL